TNNVAEMLSHIISAKEQSLGKLALSANGKHLAARIHQLVRIIRQQIKVQTVSCELGAIKLSESGPNLDVTRRQLSGGNRTWINVHRNGGQTGWKAYLPRTCRVGSQSVETVYQIARYLIRAHLRVIHSITTANGRARIAARMPAKADARLET